MTDCTTREIIFLYESYVKTWLPKPVIIVCVYMVTELSHWYSRGRNASRRSKLFTRHWTAGWRSSSTSMFDIRWTWKNSILSIDICHSSLESFITAHSLFGNRDREVSRILLEAAHFGETLEGFLFSRRSLWATCTSVTYWTGVPLLVSPRLAPHDDCQHVWFKQDASWRLVVRVLAAQCDLEYYQSSGNLSAPNSGHCTWEDINLKVQVSVIEKVKQVTVAVL
jgi:hypothetical protein